MIYSLTGKVSTLDDNTIVVDTGNMAFSKKLDFKESLRYTKAT